MTTIVSTALGTTSTPSNTSTINLATSCAGVLTKNSGLLGKDVLDLHGGAVGKGCGEYVGIKASSFVGQRLAGGSVVIPQSVKGFLGNLESSGVLKSVRKL